VPTVNPNGWYPETRHPEYALAYLRYLAGERGAPQASQMYFGINAWQAAAVRRRVRSLVAKVNAREERASALLAEIAVRDRAQDERPLAS
jgi:hypothetical protein